MVIKVNIIKFHLINTIFNTFLHLAGIKIDIKSNFFSRYVFDTWLRAPLSRTVNLTVAVKHTDVGHNSNIYILI